MFQGIYNSFSKLFSSRWPAAAGEVTSVTVDSVFGNSRQAQLVVTYEFFVAGEPYTGEASSGMFNGMRVATIASALNGIRKGDFIAVRYRPDDPTVNKATIYDLLRAL